MEDDATEDGSIDSLLDAAEVALVDEYHRGDWSDFDADLIEDDLLDVDPPSSPIKEHPLKQRLMQQ